MLLRLTSLAGIFLLVAIGWAASKDRRNINWKTVVAGLSLQFLFALLVLKSAPGRWFFEVLSEGVRKLISFTDRGAEFIWGGLYRGVPGNYADPTQSITHLFNPASGAHEPLGFVFLLNALMPIVFFAALMSVAYHLGLVQWIIVGLARVMKRFMGTSGAETLSASANIFVGQTEAPLVVKPFVDTMTKSELHAVMTGGFATVAGGVMAAYTTFGIDPGHLLAASVMSAPAALVAAKLFFPETEVSPTAGELQIELEKTSVNVIDAACNGASEGMKLVWNVAAMLLAFIALIALIDWGLGAIDELVAIRLLDAEPVGLSLGWIFGKLLFPVGLILGVPWADAEAMGSLLGTRMAINEFVAYIQLAAAEPTLSPRTFVIATYAFCGFANFSSIAIQIGGIGGIAPKRKADLARLGLRAMLAGTLASFFTAALVGVLLSEDEMAFQHYKRKTVQFMEGRDQDRLDLVDRFLADFPASDLRPDAEALRDRFIAEAGERLVGLEAALSEARHAADRERLLDAIVTMGTPDALRAAARHGRAPPAE